MSDSITFDNGLTMVNVNNLDVLSEPSQELANAIATGPQDEFFQLLESTNGLIRRISAGRNYYNMPVDDSLDISVTPSWNWRPGTYDKIRELTVKILQLNKRSNGIYKFVKRTKDNAEWSMHNIIRNFDELERLKYNLKNDGYPYNVDIEEYTDNLKSFGNVVLEECDKVTKAWPNVSIKPYVFIDEHSPRNSTFYLDITLNSLIMNIFHQSSKIQELPLEPIRIVIHNKLRDAMSNFLKVSRKNNYSFKGIYQANEYNDNYCSDGGRYFSFPYIAKARYNYDTNRYSYQAVCLDRYLDDVKRNLSNISYMEMIMNLMSWATYYNTEYSNPYNQPYELHFGMPEYMTKEYKGAFPISADNCSNRLRRVYGLNSGFPVSNMHISNQIDMANDECDRMQCQWRESCSSYVRTQHIKSIFTDENCRFQAESLLGWIKTLPDWKYAIADYYELDTSYLSDDELIINHLMINYTYGNNIYGNQMLNDYGYYNDEDGGELADRDGEASAPTREQIQQRMLQWATERSM